MTTLQQWKEKLLDILDDVFYRKSEIDQKESVINGLINGKANSSHTHGNLQNDGAVGTSNNISKNVITDANGKITTEDKPSYTPTITSSTTDSYKIGSLNLNGSNIDIYGKDTSDTSSGDADIEEAFNDLAEAIYPSE